MAETPASIKLTRHPNLVMMQDTPKGRGIFANAPIPGRTVVEISPVLILSPEETEKHISHTRLWFYTYNWNFTDPKSGRVRKTQALPLGLGSMFNHASASSPRHNVGFTRNWTNETLTYITLRDVDAGEELCICYGEDARLGFSDADAPSQQDANAQLQLDDSVWNEKLDPDAYLRIVDDSLFSDRLE